MGRHKFRLSDMIPNAWFYKLRDVRARRGAAGSGSVTQASVSRANGAGRVPSTPRRGPWLPHRESYYYASRAGELTASPLHPMASDMHFPPLPLSPPRKSKMRHRRRSVKPAPSAVSTGCRCVRKAEPAVEEPDTPPSRRDMYIGYNDDGGEFQKPMSIRIPANDDLDGKVVTSATDIIIDLRTKNSPEKVLRPILTRPARRVPDGCELEDKHIDLTHMAPRTSSVSEQSKGKPRRCVPSARRLKTRVNSPRVATKKTKPAAAWTTPLAESFAVVKSSRDPRRDFRESMEEMIVENGILTAGDLEDLLACYLSLNAAEYHDLIVEVFEQIWTSLKELKL